MVPTEVCKHQRVGAASHIGRCSPAHGQSSASEGTRESSSPCDARGKPLGSAIEAHARTLPKSEWERAERAIAANYGLGRKLYITPLRGHRDAMNYLEIRPAGA